MVVLLCGHQQSFTTWNHVTWHIEGHNQQKARLLVATFAFLELS